MRKPSTYNGQTTIGQDRVNQNENVGEARSMLLYWAHRELDIPATELAKRMKLSQPAVSQSVARGEKLIRANGYELSLDA